MLFNIVMPVYNGAKFLSLSVGSVLSQTLSDWQLLIVNDGSTDETGEIADALAARDPRITCIHQKNAGVSAARNAGIAASTAEYLIFVDADDELLPEALSLIAEQITRTAPDVVTYNTHRCDLDSRIVGQITKPISPEILTLNCAEDVRRTILPLLVSDTVFGIIGNYAVKRSIVKDLRFPTAKIMCEDLTFDMAMYERCTTAVCMPDYLYLYRDNPSGCVRTFRYEKIRDLGRTLDEKIAFAEKHSIDYSRARLLDWFCSSIVYEYFNLIENRRLANDFVRAIRGDAQIASLFGECRRLGNCSVNHKYVMGNRFERFVLRQKISLKRKIKRLLRK